MDDRAVPPHRRVRLVGALLAGAIGFLVVIAAMEARDARAGDSFDLVRWEIETLPNRWVTLFGRAIHGLPEGYASDDAVIRGYFDLPRGDEGRQALRPSLQLIVEGRIDAVLRESGVRSRIPVPASIFLPVDIQIAEAPQVLVTSPRSVVERRGAELLRPDVPLSRALDLERQAEARDDDTSALVVPSGGVATYPAVVTDRGSYASLLRVASHEWVHHYLAFYPLGFRYFASTDLHTINETVADIIGDEVAALVLDRWGDPTALAAPAPPVSTPPPGVTAVLRELRLEVDALLADGAVAEAERRMEEVRLQLEESGVSIRRLNQAYFAWYGTYAARPDAVDPLGDYLREIRARTGSLAAFIERVRDIDSRVAVEELLVDLGGALSASPAD